MKAKQNFSIFPLLIMGVFLVFASGCKKDNKKDDDIGGGKGIEYGNFTDPRDGNVYKTIAIGSQIWMADNLKYLPSVFSPASGTYTTPRYYVYGYNGNDVTEAKATSNYTTYGVLYNWPAAMADSLSSDSIPSGVQGVCPTGWHLPSDAEWTQLIDFLGGETVAGVKLKEAGTSHWKSPNPMATNETGFTAIPGGCRNSDGSFNFIGEGGGWWSTSETGCDVAWDRGMNYNYNNVFRSYCFKQDGLSVRCLKD